MAAFDRDTIIDVVLDRLGKRSASTELTSAAESEIQIVQTRLEEMPELPWFCLKIDTAQVMVADQQTISVPSGFLMEFEEGDNAMWYTNSDGDEVGLTKDDYIPLVKKFLNADAGSPTHYAIPDDSDIYFFPTPDTAFAIARFLYYVEQTVLTTNTTNSWTTYAPDLVIAELGIVMAGSYVKDAAQEQRFMRDRTEALRRLWEKDAMRKEAMMSRAMGDGP